MNIIQLQDMLKGMPDQRLQQELQSPTGSVPQYLVLSEVVRRDKVRQDGANAQPSKTTVVEDVMNAAQNPAAGVPALQQEEAPAYASGGFISPSEAMGHIGKSGYPQAPKQTPMLGQNVSSNSMFKPNMNPAPQMSGFMTQNPQQNAAVPAQHNDVYNPSYTEDYAYADGGPIKMASGDYVASVASAESGNNPYARNPYSSAAGIGQFIDSTWLEYLNDTQPGLVNKIGTSAALALKANPEMSRNAIGWYGKKNTEALSRAGFQPTDANLYLAHFLGPAGASATLGADPSTPMSKIVSPAVLKANPVLQDKTAGDMPGWAAKKVGAKPAAPVAMAGRETTRGTGVGAGGAAVGYNPATAKPGLGEGAEDNKIDFSSLSDLGSALMSKKPEPVELLPESKGNPELAMASAPKTPDEILAEYRALRQMAGGGAVGLAGGGRSDEAVKKEWEDTSWYAAPFVAADDIARLLASGIGGDQLSAYMQSLGGGDYNSLLDAEKQRTHEAQVRAGSAGTVAPYILPVKGAGAALSGAKTIGGAALSNPAIRGPLANIGTKLGLLGGAAYALSPGETPPAQEEPRPDDFRAPPSAKEAAPVEPELSPLDKLLKYYGERDAQMRQMYQDQIDKEQARLDESSGMGAFLRRMGIGMLTNSDSFGKSIQAGLANATSGYEEGRQAAMDKLRELQLKQQMAAMESGGERAKLEYDVATSGVLGTDDLIKLRGQAIQERTDRAKALADASASPEDIAADPTMQGLDSQIAELSKRLGMGGSAPTQYDYNALLAEAKRRGKI